MKPKIPFRTWLRTVLFSMLVAFAVQGITNADEVKAAFYKGNGWHKELSGIQASLPGYLRVPEVVAGALGKLWSWLH